MKTRAAPIPVVSNDEHSHAFLDPQQAAAFLKINPRTLLRWARDGVVPAHPLSGNKRRIWRFLAAELEAWASSRVNSSSEWCQNSRSR
jgi:excisionase family DNA binding protein